MNSPPNVSTAVKPASVNVEWTETPGDPDYVGIQIKCGTASVFQSPRNAKTSVHEYFISNENWDGNTFRGTCKIQAFDGLRLLAEGPSFLAPPLPTTSESPPSTPHSSPPPPPPSLVSTESSSGITTHPTSPTTTTPGPVSLPGTVSSSETAQTSTTSRPSSLPTVSSSTISENTTSAATSSTAATTVTVIPSTTSDNFTELPPSVTSPPNSTASTTTIDGGGSLSHKNTRASIIGGVFGGLIFLALLLGLSWWYVKRRRSRRPFIELGDHSVPSDNYKRASTILSFFHRRDTLDTIPYPLISDDNYSQPESKYERFNRVQQEMQEARRQRDLLRLNLSNHSSVGDTVSEGAAENDLKGSEIEQELRQRYDRLSAWVLELEAQLKAIELPPDYTSSGHA